MIVFFRAASSAFFALSVRQSIEKQDLEKLTWLFGNAELVHDQTLHGYFAGADKIAMQGLIMNQFRVAEEPGQFFKILFFNRLAHAKGKKSRGGSPEKYNHCAVL